MTVFTRAHHSPWYRQLVSTCLQPSLNQKSCNGRCTKLSVVCKIQVSRQFYTEIVILLFAENTVPEQDSSLTPSQLNSHSRSWLQCGHNVQGWGPLVTQRNDTTCCIVLVSSCCLCSLLQTLLTDEGYLLPCKFIPWSLTLAGWWHWHLFAIETTIKHNHAIQTDPCFCISCSLESSRSHTFIFAKLAVARKQKQNAGNGSVGLGNMQAVFLQHRKQTGIFKWLSRPETSRDVN